MKSGVRKYLFHTAWKPERVFGLKALANAAHLIEQQLFSRSALPVAASMLC